MLWHLINCIIIIIIIICCNSPSRTTVRCARLCLSGILKHKLEAVVSRWRWRETSRRRSCRTSTEWINKLTVITTVHLSHVTTWMQVYFINGVLSRATGFDLLIIIIIPREWALDTMHYSESHSIPVNLTFDLIIIGARGIVMDYPCAKFGNFSLSHFGFFVQTDRQTHKIESHTHRRRWTLFSCDYLWQDYN